jgi:hypothetical protein
MNPKERIDVWISPEGAITLDAVGYTGSSCEEATRFLEESLGTVGRKQRTRDYYRRQKNQQQNPETQST